MTRRRRILLSALLGLVVVGGVVLWAGWDLFVNRLGVVREGVLYRSAQLSPRKLEAVVREHGIRTVVNLREVPNPEEERMLREQGVRYVWLPSQQVPEPEHRARLLELLDHPDNLPLMVHCEHGVGRTGVISGMYRMEFEDWDVDDVLGEARFYAFGGSYWDGQDKTEFLLEYVPRHDRTHPVGDEDRQRSDPVLGPAPIGTP